MALQSSGAISLNDIQTEFGGSNPISLSEYYLNGGYTTSNNTSVPTSGAISIGNFYGTFTQFNVTITSSQKELDLYSYVTGLGWNGTDPIVVTINSGVYLWSDNTSVGGLTISNAFNSKLILANYGYIIGRGGDGGGNNGGPALVNSASGVTLINQVDAYIAGGGGGGGGQVAGGGAGGGYGSGGTLGGRSVVGGAGGGLNQSGANGGVSGVTSGQGKGGQAGGEGGGYNGSNAGTGATAGGGGGRILPGSVTIPNGVSVSPNLYFGGSGGGLNGATQEAGDVSQASGLLYAHGGGGWGESGGGSGGGAGGAAISGTAIASLTNNGTIYGAVA